MDKSILAQISRNNPRRRARSKRIDFRRAARVSAQLSEEDVSVTILKRYETQIERLGRFLGALQCPSLETFATLGAWQALLILTLLWMQVGYDSGELGLGGAGNLVSGLRRELEKLTLRVRVQLPDADVVLRPLWRAYKHWKSLEPFEFRLPVYEELALAAIGVAVCDGDFILVLFIGLGFHCLLRPGQLLPMWWMDVWVTLRGGAAGVARIRKPKIRMPPIQHVTVEFSWIAVLYQAVRQMAEGKDRERIFPWDSCTLHLKWKRTMSCLGVSSVQDVDRPEELRHYTPAGLRPGGATADYLYYQNIGRLQWRGRWKSQAVLEHYIQMGVYYLSDMTQTAESRALIAEHASIARRFITALKN